MTAYVLDGQAFLLNITNINSKLLRSAEIDRLLSKQLGAHVITDADGSEVTTCLLQVFHPDLEEFVMKIGYAELLTGPDERKSGYYCITHMGDSFYTVDDNQLDMFIRIYTEISNCLIMLFADEKFDSSS